jgi:hypothetical protein
MLILGLQDYGVENMEMVKLEHALNLPKCSKSENFRYHYSIQMFLSSTKSLILAESYNIPRAST